MKYGSWQNNAKSYAVRATGRTVTAMFLGAVSLSAVAQTPTPEPMKIQVDASYPQPLPIERGASGLAESLRRLHTRASLIQINAHPDDEDGGMLAYESRGLGADVSLLALNRGEGGQNVMTGDFWDQLGILRTQEHLAANRYYGVHLFYTRVADFGFSKTLEEALKQWDHDRVLRDVVRVVRITRPMVVTSVFAGYVSDGHGHHQTAGLMAQEVFHAAGDPTMFPEQIKEGLQPWKPLKVYARVPFAQVTPKGIFDYATGKWEPVRFKNYVTGKPIEGVPTATLTVPEGEYNALYGNNYLQIAREGLNEQKSQTGGVPIPAPGKFDSPYHLYASRVNGAALPEHEQSFFDGIDISLPGIAGYLPAKSQPEVRSRLQAIAAQVDEATRVYDANDPAKSAPALARGLDLTRALIDSLRSANIPEEARYNALHELELKKEQFNFALGQSLGMSLLATVQAKMPQVGRFGPMGPTDGVFSGAAATGTAIAGQSVLVGVHVAAQGSTPVQVDSVTLIPNTGGDWKPVEKGGIDGALQAGTAKDAYLTVTVPADAPYTEPYFSRPNLEQSYYDLKAPQYLDLPVMPYPLSAAAAYTFNGTHAEVRGVVQTAHRANGFGVVLDPLLIAPAISVRVSPPAGIMPLTSTTLALDVTVHSSVKGPAEGTVDLKLPAGWTASPATATFHTMRDNEDANLHFAITPKNVEAKSYDIAVTANYAGKQYTEGFHTIGYPGITPYPQYRAAKFRTTGVDVKVAPGLKVAYIMGSGEDVPQSLRDIGIMVTQLTAADIAQADLSAYDCIVLGIRTYAARPELRTFNQRLMDYVHNGGIVISEYQTPEYQSDFAPYPITVASDAEKVVEEDAKVTILNAKDPLFTWPNQILPSDFDGWVEERGHGFPNSFDAHYTALTEVHDKGQDPQKGGVIYARSGKGYYVYLAFAFFREMPEGVPGSFRMMANLLSLSKNPGLAHE
ncbi:N-acetylglucosaminyl deacetylase, LmbE family [Granulicella pectinivorans]|uniref:N-acetylglucosaminyl deacetylase, LmbE family n=1 Tax=Granulicella pectinivorans TaxID=474950 RepID=A0A1I6MA42_9BACT|nr:PIG-L family deacetylase [Granulicella pectinivorans]SFS12412.1 N-acetylglucosaminyl deacetylase, LmbE family [Granulicella pectinivorans]